MPATREFDDVVIFAHKGPDLHRLRAGELFTVRCDGLRSISLEVSGYEHALERARDLARCLKVAVHFSGEPLDAQRSVLESFRAGVSYVPSCPRLECRRPLAPLDHSETEEVTPPTTPLRLSWTCQCGATHADEFEFVHEVGWHLIVIASSDLVIVNADARHLANGIAGAVRAAGATADARLLHKTVANTVHLYALSPSAAKLVHRVLRGLDSIVVVPPIDLAGFREVRL